MVRVRNELVDTTVRYAGEEPTITQDRNNQRFTNEADLAAYGACCEFRREDGLCGWIEALHRVVLARSKSIVQA